DDAVVGVLQNVRVWRVVHARHHDVTAFDVAHLRLYRNAGELRQQVAYPGTGRVDDGPRGYFAGCATGCRERRAPDAAVAKRADERRANADVSTARAGIDRIADDEPCVVDPRIRVYEPFAKARLQPGAITCTVELRAERLRQRHPAAETIVEEESGADHPGGAQVRLVRQHEHQRLDDVRRGAQQHLALGKRFRDEAKLVMLEVAQAAVDQLGARRRRVRGEIVLFDEQHRQSAPGSVARDARAVDAAADHEQVEGTRLHWRSAILPDETGKSQPGRVIAAGSTQRSKSSALTRPSFNAASRSVELSWCAASAIFAAFS